MWSNNNRAHTTTWAVLRLLHQGLGPFGDSGTVPMSELFFWNSAASPQMREVQARSLSAQMDNLFRAFYGAAYETGQDAGTAAQAIVGIMVQSDRTVMDLADANDSIYRFWKEAEHAS
jgi:hypothetical protein